LGVFIHWDDKDNNKIQDCNYEATKLAIKRAVAGRPTPAKVISQKDVMHHPLAAHD
jgi:5,6,7,8-tetrahydromethanopterin hydro-lyase